MLWIFRTRGSRFIGSFRLHYLSVSRQVHSCISLLNYVNKNYFHNYINIIALKKKTYFRMMWTDILYVGWQWNHGLMLWWRFHCTGKYSLGLNNPWPSNPSAVLKHQPTDSLWMGSSEVSSLVRISSVDYSRLIPCGGVNVAWKGWVGIGAREGWNVFDRV